MRLLLIVLINLLYGGCAIWGPDYQKPVNDSPGKWRSADQYTLMGGRRLPEMTWWDRLNDPQLNRLVDQSLERNNNIQAAVGSIYKAKAILQQIEMNWVPTVNAGAGYTSVVGDHNDSTLASLPFPGGFSAGFIPNYSLNILQQLRTQEQAEANIAATVAAKNAVRLTVISQVVGSYLSLREEEYRLELQKRLAGTLEELLAAYTEAYKEGLVSLYVLQQYNIDLARARAEIPVIEFNIVRLGNAIRVLLNENPGTINPGKNFMDFENKGVVSGNLPSAVLKNRPDVIQAEATLQQSNANIGVNTSVFFPTIKLTTPLGMASNSLTNLFSGKDSYWQYQGGVNMPILNLGAYGAIKSAKAQYYTDYYAYMETVKNAFAAVDSDLSAHQKYTDSLDRMRELYHSTDERYGYENTRYQEGLVAYPAVLSLRVTLNQAGIMVAQSKLTQLLSIVRLYQDLGGGYKHHDNETARDLGNSHRLTDAF